MRVCPPLSAAVLFLLVFVLNRAWALEPQQTAPVAPGKELKGGKARVSAPDVPPADLKELTAGNRAFALELYQSLRTKPGNLFLSPHSISAALAMTYAGARGQTAAEMAKTLHFTLRAERLHPAFNGLDLELASRAGATTGPGRDAIRLHIVNRLWAQAGFAFLPTFLDAVGEDYGAGVSLMDFVTAAEESRQAINEWVSQATEKKIKELLKPGIVGPDTRLVLTNAVYFKAPWESPFEKPQTKPLPFHPLQGSAFDVPMMQQQHAFLYGKGDGFQAIQLNYGDGELGMLIVVPDAGQFARIESSLTGEHLAATARSLQHQQVRLALPKFTFTSEYELKAALIAQGMPTAFSNDADFSGMTGKRDLAIDKVIHQAFVLVDETGTEAAAATAVLMRPTGAAPSREPIVLTIDRPFLFFIRDIQTEAILFVGRVVSPKG
jgi:serpin B